MLQLRDYQRQAEEAATNDNVFWHDLPIEKLPGSAAKAKEIGCSFFYTGIECVHGHLAPKYTAGGRCVVCTHESAERDRKRNWVGKKGAARAHLVRAIALLDGKKTYVPDAPCKNGHSLRWTGTNNCVECEQEKKAGYSEKRREQRLVKKYGMTNEDYCAMVDAQMGACLICEEVQVDRTSFHVDHCHGSGKVRGLLCQQCNQAIGLLRDDVKIITAAARYVEMHKEEAQC